HPRAHPPDRGPGDEQAPSPQLRHRRPRPARGVARVHRTGIACRPGGWHARGVLREPPNLTVRAAGPTDADQIATVHVASWRAGYAGIFPADWLESPEFEQGRRERWQQWRVGAGERIAVATAPAEPDAGDEPVVV